MSNTLSELRGHERTRGRARAIGRAALGGGRHAQAHIVCNGFHSEGVASWSGGHVRRRPRWWSLWALALVLAVLPRLAFAAPFFEVERNWADTEGGDVYYGYLAVDCPSAYQASLLLIDEYSTLIQIDTETYDKLMSSTTGGNFYTLVQQWGAVGPAEGNNQRIYPAWAGDVGFQMGLVNVYGYERVWGAEITDTLKASAKEDFLAILGGGSVGGGGSGGGGSGSVNADGWYEIQLTGVYTPNSLYHYADTNLVSSITINHSTGKGNVVYGAAYTNLVWAEGQTLTMYVDPYTLQQARNKADSLGFDFDDAYVMFCRSYQTPYFIVSSGEFELEYKSGYYYVKNVTEESLKYFTYKRSSERCGWYDNEYCTFLYNGSLDVNRSVAAGATDTTMLSPYWNSWGDGSGGSGGGGGEDPTPEPTPTPEPNPIAPQPPDLPEPGDPVVPDPPDPVGGGDTTITTNITITNVTNPSNTTPADYTPWLEALLNELKAFHTDLGVAFNQLWAVLDEHCVHIQDKIAEGANYVGDCVQGVSATVSSGFSSLLDYLRTLFQGLFEFLEEQSQWLVDNLRFVTNVTVDQYDDTSLLYWLRRIYARLGSGIVNTRPTDPVTDWDPWAEWLAQLVQHILNVLTGGIGGVIGNVVNAIGTLSSVFPFCIPFDLLLLMDAITTNPVTPYISVTMPATDWYHSFTIEVDCEVYDDAMDVIRSFELLAFVVYVMLHSKELFGWNAGEFSKFWSVGDPT